MRTVYMKIMYVLHISAYILGSIQLLKYKDGDVYTRASTLHLSSK